MKQLRLSKSKILDYLQCHLKYRYKHVEKIEGVTIPQMEYGREVHETIEKFYKSIDAEFLPTNSGEIMQQVRKHAKEYTTEINNFVKFNETAISSNGKQWQPIAVEQKYYDEQTDFVGVIDAVFKKDSKILILDFKTSSYNKEYISNYRFELAGYAMLWDKFNKQKSTHWGVAFLGSNNKIWTEKVNERSMRSFTLKLARAKHDIKQEKFEPNYGNHCKRCQYYYKCYGGS